VVLEKDGEDQLDRSCVKHEVLHGINEKMNILYTVMRRKANWIGHIFRRNCLIKRVTEGKIEGEIELTGRRGRKRNQPLDGFKERRGCWKLKVEALVRTFWRTRFGRSYGAVARQNME